MRLLPLLLLPLAGCATVDEALAVDEDGNDRASVQERWPTAAWLPLQGPLLQHELKIVVLVNGMPAVATLDTGATVTSISSTTAHALGLDDAVAASSDRRGFVDAHGARSESVVVEVDSIAIGSAWMEHQRVDVFPADRDVFLVGLDLLQDFDILIAGDQGVVGLFPAGTGPKQDDDLVVPLEFRDNSLYVKAASTGAYGEAVTELVVDTGAGGTTFPSAPGLAAGVKADLRFKTITQGVASQKEERGRFLLDPLRLGAAGVNVGTVAAWEAIHNDGNGPGLLGVDVFLRFRTLIQPKATQLRLRPLAPRPNRRDTGPAGYNCPDGCVSVAVIARDGDAAIADFGDTLKDLTHRYVEAQYREQTGQAPASSGEFIVGREDRACLAVDVHGVWAGHTVEFAVTDADRQPGGRLAGGALTVIVNVPKSKGFHECIQLPPSTQALGLDPGTPLSLRFLRSDRAVSTKCDGDYCVYWSGL